MRSGSRCVSTKSSDAGAKDGDDPQQQTLAEFWLALDWRDVLRRRVCTVQNWRSGRYIRRVYTLPSMAYPVKWYILEQSATNVLLQGRTDHNGMVEKTYVVENGTVPSGERRKWLNFRCWWQKKLHVPVDLSEAQPYEFTSSEELDMLSYAHHRISSRFIATCINDYRDDHSLIEVRSLDTYRLQLNFKLTSGAHIIAMRGHWMLLMHLHSDSNYEHTPYILTMWNVEHGVACPSLEVMRMDQLHCFLHSDSYSAVIYIASVGEDRRMHWSVYRFTVDTPPVLVQQGCDTSAHLTHIDSLLPIHLLEEHTDRRHILVLRAHTDNWRYMYKHTVSLSSGQASASMPSFMTTSRNTADVVSLQKGFACLRNCRVYNYCGTDTPFRAVGKTANSLGQFCIDDLCVAHTCRMRRRRTCVLNARTGALHKSPVPANIDAHSYMITMTGIMRLLEHPSRLEIIDYGAA
ncbi:hypothetical protein THASP1DRAFT_32967 [Thamnocephalis sphaerospora]|uniref:Uncharacterized protein n=1 Tax=Thamnocephalis sphaerospora TaxID=78915 RepID=A0A4P9XHL6_9FUNG|nr:hypothetical protein THASP1DRAFT_32967 [Thamnocephalis sphaerospora]|eukprot:RKP05194.1 hypothetical protein THASP1DRAFT_32967 [Thamnocephalis sphaerospora]